MINRLFLWISTLALILAISGCGNDEMPLRIGSKNYGENQLLAEMVAALAEQEGIPVHRMMGIGSTKVNLEALKRGDIDMYIDVNGTGLVMLGQPAMADGDAAIVKVRELYKPLGLHWGKRFGFANNFGILMFKDRARELGVSTISDLAKISHDLTIGIEESFQRRPLDGIKAMTRRYGMSFANVEVVSVDERLKLYDSLISGRVDLIEGYTTDGQIVDYNLVVLEDDLEFFPVYEAAPLVREDVLQRYPNFLSITDLLAGKLQEEFMRELNRLIDIQGQAPKAVARKALADLGLLKNVKVVQSSEPLWVATAPFSEAEGEIGAALNAIGKVFSGRQVQLLPVQNSLKAISKGEARLALVGAHEFTRAVSGEDVGNFEAVGVVGETMVHILSLQEGVAQLEDADTIAVGSSDSVSERTARILVDGLNLDASLLNTMGGKAQIAVLVAPLGNELVTRLIGRGARLLSLSNWNQGDNLIRYPALHRTRIPAATYPGQDKAVDTLSAQLVLASAGEIEGGASGGRGAAYSGAAQPLADATVTALHDALNSSIDIDPVVRQAVVLRPRLPEPPSPVNPSPGQSVLNVVLLVMLIWLTWVFVRSEPSKTEDAD